MEQTPLVHSVHSRQSPSSRPPVVRCVAAAVIGLATASGQAPSLLRDVNAVPIAVTSSTPTQFTALGTRVFCSAQTASVGREPWCFDALGGPASLVADVRPGPAGSEPSALTPFGGLLFFVADDGVHGRELWRTDGTSVGTQLVLDLAPGSASAEPEELTVVGSRLYFVATSPLGRELWHSDGTAAGTQLVADLEPGPGSATPRHLTAHGGELFFQAAVLSSGAELWRTDGTATGTQLVQDLLPGAVGSDPDLLCSIGSWLVFRAAGGLWRSDGTAAGTQQLGAVAPTAIVSAGAFAYCLGGAGGMDVYVTDGMAAGTRIVDRIGYPPQPSGHATHLSVIGGRAVILVEIGTLGFLFGCDGVTISQLPVLCEASAAAQAQLGQRLLFRAHSGSYEQVWQTDGTVAGTFPVVQSYLLLAAPGEFVAVPAAGRVVFAADSVAHGREPWVTDGTFAGTRLVHDLDAGGPGATRASSPTAFVDAGGIAYFTAFDGMRSTLWRTDGTTAGTWPVVGNPALQPQAPEELCAVGTRVFFTAQGLQGREVWVSDGTATGTHRLPDPPSGPTGSTPRDLTPAGDRLYFVAHTPQATVWCTDGTSQGTVQVSAPDQDYIGIAAALGRGVLYQAWTAAAGSEPWYTAGSAASTVALGDLTPGPNGSALEGLVVWQNRGYFVLGSRFYVTDGTAAGTQAFLSNVLVTDGPYAAGNAVYFAAPDFASSGTSVWRTDGTLAGTQRVVAYPTPHGVRWLGQIGEVLLYSVLHGTSESLHRTDGTPAGTFALGSLPVGALLGIDARQAFFASADQAGAELWRTDGTLAGTGRIADLWPGATSSTPAAFGLSSGRLLFAADHPTYGREPWVLQVGASVQDIGHGCAFPGPAPRLTATTPVLGSNSTLAVHGGPASGFAIALASLHTTGSFRLPNGRCDLFLDPALVVLGIPLLQAGTGSLPLGLPSDPQLAGVGLRAQFLLVPAAATGIEATQALALTLGF